MWLGTQAPHKPAIPPPRYADRFPDAVAPRPPSFDEADISDKPGWVRQKAPLTSAEISGLNTFYRNRLRSMMAVDDLVGKVVDSLRYSGKLSNTYIVFTSDNGMSMGEHGRDVGKWSAYEEDMKVPLIVRGPNVPEGVKRTHTVLNNDFAPTFAQLGRVSVPSFVDGRSFVPLLRSGPPAPSNWRSAFLEEAVANAVDRPAFKAVRTHKHLWVEYANGERELYDLRRDPHQLQSRSPKDNQRLVRGLNNQLDRLATCKGEGCRAAEAN
jgi:arylsulfatase A-like enzyme